MVRLTVREGGGRGGGSATSALTVSKCENFEFSFSIKLDSLTLKTHFVSLWGVSKMHFSCPFHLHCFRNIYPLWECLVLFQRYPFSLRAACANLEIYSTMRAACAILEIYSTMRGLCYFRNIFHYERLVLFQKYIPLWKACGISEITIYYESGMRYFRNMHLLWDEQQ